MVKLNSPHEFGWREAEINRFVRFHSFTGGETTEIDESVAGSSVSHVDIHMKSEDPSYSDPCPARALLPVGFASGSGPAIVFT